VALDEKLLEILACPSCKHGVRYDAKKERIYCLNQECGLIFPVKDGIPVMLIDEAIKEA
jgi:hypothetical protein